MAVHHTAVDMWNRVKESVRQLTDAELNALEPCSCHGVSCRRCAAVTVRHEREDVVKSRHHE